MIQELMQNALAVAVLMLGLVVALELRSLRRLRGGLARDVERLFEQLDLVRFDGQRVVDAQRADVPRIDTRPAVRTAPTAPVALPMVQGSVAADYVAAGQFAAGGANATDIARRSAGEARVLAALQKMRNERGTTH
ncbi:MAG TPA: hypothetical protein VMI92_05575 [Steroidobacteraceae bacterium]|nr:hypothetical protein [Steroidobacteraceae bacterium]